MPLRTRTGFGSCVPLRCRYQQRQARRWRRQHSPGQGCRSTQASPTRGRGGRGRTRRCKPGLAPWSIHLDALAAHGTLPVWQVAGAAGGEKGRCPPPPAPERILGRGCRSPCGPHRLWVLAASSRACHWSTATCARVLRNTALPRKPRPALRPMARQQPLLPATVLATPGQVPGARHDLLGQTLHCRCPSPACRTVPV